MNVFCFQKNIHLTILKNQTNTTEYFTNEKKKKDRNISV